MCWTGSMLNWDFCPHHFSPLLANRRDCSDFKADITTPVENQCGRDSSFFFFVLSSRRGKLKSVQDTENCVLLNKNENSYTECSCDSCKWCADSLPSSKRMHWLLGGFIFPMQRFLISLDKERLWRWISHSHWDPAWIMQLQLGLGLLLL